MTEYCFNCGIAETDLETNGSTTLTCKEHPKENLPLEIEVLPEPGKAGCLEKVTHIVLERLEFGAKFLAENRIIPVFNDKGPDCKSSRNPGGDWRQFLTSEFKYRPMPAGLAVIVGDDFRVLDIDDKDLVFGNPNVTTAKGAHYYYQTDGPDKSKRYGNVLDIKTTGYVIFWGKDKIFNHSTVSTWQSLNIPFNISSLLPPLTECSGGMKFKDEVKGRSEGMKCIPPRGIQPSLTYTEQVEMQQVGQFTLYLEKDKIMESYQTQMMKCSPGGRNNLLFRVTIEAKRIGGDLTILRDAADKSGLPPREVDYTIGRAEAGYEIDRGKSILDRVHVWYEHACQFVTTDRQQTVLDYVYLCAVRRNSLLPQVNQEALETLTGVSQGYISRILNDLLCKKAGVLECERPKGKQSNGHDWPNNYYLCIGGSRVEDNLPLIDSMVDKG